MLYLIAKRVLSYGLTHFFNTIRVGGVSKVEHGPVILVANHPNYALDPLIIGSSFRRPLWFVARSTLFKTQFLRWFFKQCHMVPIMRRMDNPEGNLDNKETFRFVAEVLVNGGGLCIFPEGISLGERKLSPLKTGTARIAFQAEEAQAFELGLVVQPIGLTYTDLRKFKSAVTLTFGVPICVADLRSEYEKDAMEAVRMLTDQIETGIRSVTVEVAEIEQVALVEKVTTVFKTRSSQIDDLELMRVIAVNVNILREKDRKRSIEVERRIDNYLMLAKLFNIDGTFALDVDYNRVLAILRCPLVLIGSVINYIPYRLVGKIVTLLSRHEVDLASKKFGVGFVLFPVWFLVISSLVGSFLGSTLWFLFSFLLCLVSGIFVNRYLDEVRLLLLSILWPGHRKPSEVLKLMRDELIAELESLRVV